MINGEPPRVELGEGWWSGSTARLVTAIKEQLALEATVVDARWLASDRYAVELATPAAGWAGVDGATWIGLTDLADTDVAGLLHDVATRESWLRPGWPAAIAEWIDARVAELGVERTGRLEQLKHWSISALLRVPARPHDLVFKEVAPFFAQEAPILSVLHPLAPEAVPEPLAIEGGRWLMPRFEGDLPDAAGHDDYDAVLTLHARLQQASAGHTDALLAAGALDHSQALIEEALTRIAGRDDIRGAMSPESRAAYEEALPRIIECCRQLDSLGVPPTVVHGDFHQWNVIRTGAGWLIYDWTDACVANPFLDLCPWLWHIESPTQRARAASTYTSMWKESLGSDVAAEACRLAQVAAAAHYATDYEILIDGVRPAYRGEWAPALVTWLERTVKAVRQLDGK